MRSAAGTIAGKGELHTLAAGINGPADVVPGPEGLGRLDPLNGLVPAADPVTHRRVEQQAAGTEGPVTQGPSHFGAFTRRRRIRTGPQQQVGAAQAQPRVRIGRLVLQGLLEMDLGGRGVASPQGLRAFQAQPLGRWPDAGGPVGGQAPQGQLVQGARAAARVQLQGRRVVRRGRLEIAQPQQQPSVAEPERDIAPITLHAHRQQGHGLLMLAAGFVELGQPEPALDVARVELDHLPQVRLDLGLPAAGVKQLDPRPAQPRLGRMRGDGFGAGGQGAGRAGGRFGGDDLKPLVGRAFGWIRQCRGQGSMTQAHPIKELRDVNIAQGSGHRRGHHDGARRATLTSPDTSA